MKSDYGQLNKAKPVSFEAVFEHHAKISRAIHTLVKTAYLNHHLEEKNRRKELVKCLDGNANILIDQLGDDNFKNTLKDTVQELLIKEFKVSQDAKKQLVDDIESVLNGKIRKTLSESSPKKHVKSNAEYTKRLSEFCINVLKVGNTKRMEILKDEFGTSSGGQPGARSVEKTQSHVKRRYDDLVRLIGGLKNGKQSGKQTGNSTAFLGFSRYIKKRYVGLTKQLKNVNTKVIRRIKTAFTKKAVLGFIGGVVEGVNRVVTDILKGFFSLIKGIISVAFGLVKTAFGIVTKVVKGILNVCKKIVSYVKDLAVGFLERFGKFLMTPGGMFIVGYIAGFIYQKIVGKYDEYKEKAKGWWDVKKKKIHETRMGIVDYFKNNPFVMSLRSLAIAHLNMKAFKTKMSKMSIQLNRFSMSGAIGGAVGGQIGAWIGRVVGGFVGTFFGPLQPLIMGVGTALGAIAGYYIGKAYGSVPEKPATERGQKNMFVAAVTNKYKQKREKRIRGIRSSLKGEIDELDKKANDESYDDKQRAKFAKQRDELKSRLDGISGTMMINDEDDEERERHANIVGNIQKLLELEQKRDGGNSIFKVLKSGTTKEVVDFTVDSVIKQAERGNISYNEFGLNNINIDRQRLKAYNVLSKIKQNALNVAVDAYQKGMIPYSDIQPVANGLVSKYADQVQCKIKRNIPTTGYTGVGGYASYQYSDAARYSESISLKDYIMSGRNENIDTTEQKSNELWNSMSKDVSDRFEITDWQQDTIDSLTNEFISQYKKARGNNSVSNEHIEKYRDVILSLFHDFVVKNGIKTHDDIKKADGAYKELQKNIVGLLKDSSIPENESDNIPAIDKVLSGLFEFLKTPVGDKDMDAEIAMKCSEAQKSLGLDVSESNDENPMDPLFISKNRNEKLRLENRNLLEKVIELGIDTNLFYQQTPDDRETTPSDDHTEVEKTR